MSKHKDIKGRSGSVGERRVATSGAPMRGQGFAGRRVALPVLDQECCLQAAELFPTSFDWTDSNDYLDSVEETARKIAEGGGEPFYVFLDLPRYVEWCREQGVPVDSELSRSSFAAASLAEGDAAPYRPEQPLWPMAVTSMVLRSELGERVDPNGGGPRSVEFRKQFKDFITGLSGEGRCIITAARFGGQDEAGMWQNFTAAVRSSTWLLVSYDYLSVTEEVEFRDDKLVSTDYYGQHHPFEALLALAVAGHGLVGIEHRDGDTFTFRAFAITPAGCEPVPVDVLGSRLGTPGAPSLRFGWADEV